MTARSSSVPSSGRRASTRSPSAPTRRGTCGPLTFPLLPASGTPPNDADVRDHRPGRRRAGRRSRSEPRASRDHVTSMTVGPADRPAPRSYSGTSDPGEKEATVIRFVIRRLMWAIPTLLIVTFLVYVAIRIGTDPVESYLRINPRASQAKIQQYIEANGLYDGFGGYVRGYFKWLGRFLTGDWPRQHQGQPRGVAQPQGRDGQLAAPRRHRHHRRHRHRLHDRHLRRAAARQRCATASVNTTAFVGLSIPPYVSAVHPAAGLRRLHAAVVPGRSRGCIPDVGRLPAGPPGLRPRRAAAQAPDPAGHRGRDPDRSPSTPATCGPRCSRC